MIAPVRDGAGHPHRRLILAICSMSLFIVGIDATIVNLALPAIRTDFGATVAQLQWIIDSYTFVLAALVILSGSMADRFGRARVFKLGLLVFVSGSLACSLAPSVEVLIAGRVAQGVGGSMMNPVAMSIIRNAFTDPAERARAIGVWAGVVGLSMGLGPLIGGALVEALGWRAIFLINVPVGLAAIVLTVRYVPESQAEQPRRFDPIGQLLLVVVLASLTFGIIEGPAAGWGSTLIVGCFGVTLVGVLAFVPYERRRHEPLLDLRFFRSAPFTGATIINCTTFAAFGGFLFLSTIYLQTVRGLSPFDAGLYMLPVAALTLVFAPISGHLVGRHGARPSLVVGGGSLAIAGLMLTKLTATTSDVTLLVTYLVFGFGFALVNPATTNTAVSGMPAAQAGVAAAVASSSRQVGVLLGVALVGVLASPAAGDASSIVEIAPAAWWFLAACGAVGLVTGIATTGRWALRTATRSRASLGTPT